MTKTTGSFLGRADPWPIVFVLALLQAGGSAGACRRVGLARAQADQPPRQGDDALFHWGGRAPSHGPMDDPADLYVGVRPDCGERFSKVLPLAEIIGRCPVKGRPIVLSGPTWCRYRFDEGSFVLVESPSFAYLRQALVEGATIRTSTGWGFVWTNSRGISSVVLRKPDGAALVVQAPGRICSRDGLVRLALDAASRLEAGRTGRPGP